MTAAGLSDVEVSTLERLLQLVQRGRLKPPFTPVDLAAHNVAHAPALAGLLGDLDASALERVLQLLIAERSRPDTCALELVWTGPEHRAATSRDTALIVRDLFSRAQHSVLVAGFSFDHGESILEPLHRAMRERDVRAELFLNLDRKPHDPRQGPAIAVEFCERFLRDNWPFGAPRPQLYFDARQLRAGGAYVSLHAKCVVVDERHTLITSANFTDRGHTRNIELGVLVEDADFATGVVAQWRGLVRDKHVLSV